MSILLDPKGATTVQTLFQRNVLVASGTATFAGIDLEDYQGNVLLVLSSYNPATDGSTGAQVSILESSDNSTFATWAAAPTFSLITASSSTQTVLLDRRATKKYIQGKHVVTGTTATYALCLTAIGFANTN